MSSSNRAYFMRREGELWTITSNACPPWQRIVATESLERAMDLWTRFIDRALEAGMEGSFFRELPK